MLILGHFYNLLPEMNVQFKILQVCAVNNVTKGHMCSWVARAQTDCTWPNTLILNLRDIWSLQFAYEANGDLLKNNQYDCLSFMHS